MLLDAQSIHEPTLRAVYDYWQEKRGGRSLPARRDLDPVAEVPRLAPYLILVETAPAVEEFHFRLYGSAVAAGFGEDRTGWRLRDLQKIEHYADVVASYRRVRDDRAPLYTPRRVVSTVRNYSAYSRLLLPLSGDGQAVDMIIGAIVFLGPQTKR